MKVLVVHNRYRSEFPSGENTVVDVEIEALRSFGVEVITHLRSSDEISGLPLRERLAVPLRAVSSREDRGAIVALIERHQPDVLHLHNPYPLISPRVITTAKAMRVPVVQTVHNFRHVCSNGQLFRDGRLCHECVGRRVPLPSVRYGCYQDSRARSLGMAVAMVSARPAWRDVGRFLALTDFQRDFLVRLGLPPDRVVVRPAGLADPGHDPLSASVTRTFTFVGRLDVAKGIEILVEAWRGLDGLGDWNLDVVGDGPLRPAIEELAANDLRVHWHGLASPDRVDQLLRKATVVVMPSLGLEGQPRVALEALARGKPIVHTRHGALPSVIGEAAGWGIDPTADALSKTLMRVANSMDLPAKSSAARQLFLDRYTEHVALQALVAVYNSVT